MSLRLTLLILLITQTCVNKKDETAKPTRIAVRNSNATAIDVTVKSSDNSKTEVFSATPGNSTSSAREISFPSLSGVQVSCSATGCIAGTVTLTANQDNAVTVVSGSMPTVSTGTSTSSGW
jgi:uncharacterized cupin superfamily protein